MARFVKHEPCPKCGSRNNLGRYDDGSAYCFGCSYSERSDGKQRQVFKEMSEDENSIPKLPDDTGTSFSEEAVQWLGQYHVSVEQAIKNNIRWSNSRKQLIFLLQDGCWQARNFSQGIQPRSKYFTAGNVNDSIKLYLGHAPKLLESSRESTTKETRGSTLVIVEDCVSAIRVSEASWFDAMPILGSVVATSKLTRLARLYSSLIVWNDSDKLTESRNLARRAQLLGMTAHVVHTELDPKCYTNNQIMEFIND